MRTRNNIQYHGILTSDWHAREDTPVGRTDDYLAAFLRKVDFISDLQKQYQCLVFHAGDLFDNWKPSPNLLRLMIEHIPDKFYTVYGQHDVPQHSLDLVHKCGINCLVSAGKVNVLEGSHWGMVPGVNQISIEVPQVDKRILVWHRYTYQGTKAIFSKIQDNAHAILSKYPFDLILTGDNHKAFVEHYIDKDERVRVLVNPGSIMRMDADQIDFKPRVYLWNAELNTVTPVYLPIEEGVISRTHLIKKAERESRLDAFINQLDTEFEGVADFEKNLETFRLTNNPRQSVMNIIYKSMMDKKEQI